MVCSIFERGRVFLGGPSGLAYPPAMAKNGSRCKGVLGYLLRDLGIFMIRRQPSNEAAALFWKGGGDFFRVLIDRIGNSNPVRIRKEKFERKDEKCDD